MRTLQQTFDVVIDKGFYGVYDSWDVVDREDCADSQYMCNSLKLAHDAGIITEKEMHNALLSIQSWMASVTGSPASSLTMKHVLYISKKVPWYPASFGERLDLYRNWAKRPRWNRKMWERSYA